MRKREIDQKLFIMIGCAIIGVLIVFCLFIRMTNVGACMVAGGSWSDGSCSNGLTYKHGKKFSGEMDNVTYQNGQKAYTTKIYYTNVDHVLTLSSDEISSDSFKGNQTFEASLVDPTDIEKVVIDGTIVPTSTAHWFQGMNRLKEIEGIENLDTSNVTDMSYMFDGCSSLSELDLSGFTTTNVTTLKCMFQNCSSLQKINLSNWNTLNVEDLSYVFAGNSSLSTIEGLEDLNTVAVSNMDSLFYLCGSLTSLNLSGWRVSAVENMAFMFANCSKLETIDTTGWKTNSLKTMSGTFKESPALREITGLNDWNVQKVVEFNRTFAFCTSLTSLDLSNWKTYKAQTFGQMFNGCTNLQTLDIYYFTNYYITSEKPTYTSRPDRSYVNEMGYQYMFQNCVSLTSVKTSQNWVHNPQIDTDMFTGTDFTMSY